MIDIRYPIGLLFSIIGVVLLVYGIVTMHNTDLYQKSLGVDINIWAGILMLIFGVIMLALSNGVREKQ
jgi:multisubunit Na+/H+ antiporter MnhG subunit